MNNSASSILSALLTNLNAVTELAEVNSGRTADFGTGYPAALVYLSGINNQLQDNAPTWLRTYIYNVEVLQLTESGNKAACETAFEGAVDAVLDKLGAEWDDSSVDIAIVEDAAVRYEEASAGPTVSCIITLQARTVIA